MKIYKIIWKSWDFSTSNPEIKIEDFDDVQWKDYGVRATVDDPHKVMVIPYTSIYDVEIIDED